MNKTVLLLGDSLTAGHPGAAYFDLLQTNLPGYELINLGKGGDTVKSLYLRILTTELETSVDITLIWIGVNDFLVKKSFLAPIRKLIRRQPWTKNQQEFNSYYRRLLDYISPRSCRIITVPPLFIGEEPDNPWNRKLEAAAAEIQDITAEYPAATYLDLRAKFIPLPDDHRPVKQGYFTIDGVHLNKQGAEVVAAALSEIISSQIIDSSVDAKT